MSEQVPLPDQDSEFEWQRKGVLPARRSPMVAVVDAWLSAQRERFTALTGGACDSPIEDLFLAAWLALTPHAQAEKPEMVRKQGFPCRRAFYDPIANSYLMTQVEQVVSGRAIRLDFALIHQKTKVTVEADGHEWHERSKEQAANDKSRDRLLLADGWSVLRFTGSEIHADPIRCAKEAVTILRGVAPKPVVAEKAKKKRTSHNRALPVFRDEAQRGPPAPPEVAQKYIGQILEMLEGLEGR